MTQRVAEYHEVQVGGALPDPQHQDLGSILTLDIMLSQPGLDFEGTLILSRINFVCSVSNALNPLALFRGHIFNAGV